MECFLIHVGSNILQGKLFFKSSLGPALCAGDDYPRVDATHVRQWNDPCARVGSVVDFRISGAWRNETVNTIGTPKYGKFVVSSRITPRYPSAPSAAEQSGPPHSQSRLAAAGLRFAPEVEKVFRHDSPPIVNNLRLRVSQDH